MSNVRPGDLLTRRGILTASALLFAASSVAHAAPAGVKPWLAYEEQLTTRLHDAGGGQFDLDCAQALTDQANRFRAEQGLGALAWNDGLAACARAHIADLTARDYFSHQSPEGFDQADRVALLNRDFCGQTGENLAWRDDPLERTMPDQFQQMWEGSPEHRRNLTNPGFIQVGYGVVRHGSKVLAAGVYASDCLRLDRPMPLKMRTDAELALSLANALPDLGRLSLTHPFEHPTWTAKSSDRLPHLPTGIWQLRPLKPAGGSRLEVLTGPLFQMG
jgi:uncharacterized protein YkwD